jgi:hypothetical protein
MYGCSNAIIIYGFKEDSGHEYLDIDYLENLGVEMYAVDVVRDCMNEAEYGIPCEFDDYTGKVVYPNENDIKTVEDLYTKFMEFHNGNRNSRLGYYLVVSGDYNICSQPYNLI